MLAVQTEVDGFPLLNFPNVCSEEPKPGSVFCEGHHQLLEQKSIPTEKGAFLKYLGCKGNFLSHTLKSYFGTCIELKLRNVILFT